MDIDGILNLDGIIASNGANGGGDGVGGIGDGGGGSGGSVYIRTKGVSGTGSITANGGSSVGSGVNGGGGSGGRIALYYGSNSSWLGSYNVNGGSGNVAGAAGTYYQQFVPDRIPPIFDEFDDVETTNFSDETEVPDLKNVDTPVLANAQAKVEWHGLGYDISGVNLNEHIEFRQNFVHLDSTHVPGLNSTANITLKTTSYPNLMAYNIIKNGQLCSDCTKYAANPVKFKVTGFSNYTTNGTGIVPEFANSSTILLVGLAVVLFIVVWVRRTA